MQDLKNEVLIYDLSINKAFCLNQTSALVYQLADGTKTVSEIGNAMSVTLKTFVSEDVVYLALNELKKDNLLENADEIPNHFGGLTRREAVKRVGLASMVMLPIITSVVAPSAAVAQSSGLPCIVGQCFATGSSFCIACAGRITFDIFNSLDGTCSGGLFFSGGSTTCVPNTFTSRDLRITSIP